MITKVTVKTIYNCSLERAFKTPMLCDVAKIHTGYWIMPKVTHCTEDENWGIPGNSKKVFFAKSFTQKGGWGSMDKVIERIENKYWKIEVAIFKLGCWGFLNLLENGALTEIEPNKIQIEYTYSMHSKSKILYPLNWLFAKLFWKVYMKRVLENIRNMVSANEPYLFP